MLMSNKDKLISLLMLKYMNNGSSLKLKGNTVLIDERDLIHINLPNIDGRDLLHELQEEQLIEIKRKLPCCDFYKPWEIIIKPKCIRYFDTKKWRVLRMFYKNKFYFPPIIH